MQQKKGFAMGSYVERYWISDASGMNKAERMGGAYRPYLPDMISGFDLMMEPTCASAVARAQEALRSLEKAGSLTDTEPLARLLLRAEAVSSSRIEGLEMPAGKLLEYEELDRLGVEHRLDSTEAQVINNLHALVEGLTTVKPGHVFTVEEICDLNRALLADTRIAEAGGHGRNQRFAQNAELDRRQPGEPGGGSLRTARTRSRADIDG